MPNLNVGTLDIFGKTGLRLKGQAFQAWTLKLVNTAGTIQHSIVTSILGNTLPTYSSKISGASATLANTPSVAAGVDFTSGGGLEAADNARFIFNVGAQTEADFVGRAFRAASTAGPGLDIEPHFYSSNVNGVTQVRFAIKLRRSDTGANFNITTANITAGNSHFINIQAHLA